MITFFLFFYAVVLTVCFWLFRKKALVYKKMCESFNILEGYQDGNDI